MLNWIYWGKLYNSKFQAQTLQQRLEHDAWIYGYETPQEIEIFRSRRGKYGVRFLL
ncbi:hypothetical protein MH117_10025 [Paenibacillus sp. ACRRX]|uniref:hypothetical protein n=1 Tax=unclassified Paenibacillus TaxID=185978 RepID=UPI001EF5B85D|nr:MULTISPECIES: hypothetical protein [unclassified Paenibacillus]MCG7407759.1 hypothetical protein [Paenibacillus sp. ACRRX]MDK8180902.1 hypothetical protein [Paenibacillus sp. UMB4589-SE434]